MDRLELMRIVTGGNDGRIEALCYIYPVVRFTRFYCRSSARCSCMMNRYWQGNNRVTTMDSLELMRIVTGGNDGRIEALCYIYPVVRFTRFYCRSSARCC